MYILYIFRAIPKSVCELFRFISNQFEKGFVSHFMENSQKLIWINSIHSAWIRINSNLDVSRLNFQYEKIRFNPRLEQFWLMPRIIILFFKCMLLIIFEKFKKLKIILCPKKTKIKIIIKFLGQEISSRVIYIYISVSEPIRKLFISCLMKNVKIQFYLIWFIPLQSEASIRVAPTSDSIKSIPIENSVWINLTSNWFELKRNESN